MLATLNFSFNPAETFEFDSTKWWVDFNEDWKGATDQDLLTDYQDHVVDYLVAVRLGFEQCKPPSFAGFRRYLLKYKSINSHSVDAQCQRITMASKVALHRHAVSSLLHPLIEHQHPGVTAEYLSQGHDAVLVRIEVHSNCELHVLRNSVYLGDLNHPPADVKTFYPQSASLRGVYSYIYAADQSIRMPRTFETIGYHSAGLSTEVDYVDSRWFSDLVPSHVRDLPQPQPEEPLVDFHIRLGYTQALAQKAQHL